MSISAFTLLLTATLTAPQAKSKTAVPSYVKLPFNRTWKKLPSGYFGHDIKKICNILAKRAKAKGEFETTLEYEARIDSLPKKPLDGQLMVDSLMAFQLEERDGYEYNADSSRMSYLGIFPEINLDGSPTMFLRSDGDYTAAGQVAGLKTLPTLTQYGVFVTELRSWRIYRDELKLFQFDFPMERTEAKLSKNDLRLMAICQPVPPYIVGDSSLDGRESPFAELNVENRQEFISVRIGLPVKLEKILVFNSKTGKIIHEVKPLRP